MWMRIAALMIGAMPLGGCLATVAESQGESYQQMSDRIDRERASQMEAMCGQDDMSVSFARCARDALRVMREQLRAEQAAGPPRTVYVERPAPVVTSPAPRTPLNCSTVYYPLGPQTTCF